MALPSENQIRDKRFQDYLKQKQKARDTYRDIKLISNIFKNSKNSLINFDYDGSEELTNWIDSLISGDPVKEVE